MSSVALAVQVPPAVIAAGAPQPAAESSPALAFDALLPDGVAALLSLEPLSAGKSGTDGAAESAAPPQATAVLSDPAPPQGPDDPLATPPDTAPASLPGLAAAAPIPVPDAIVGSAEEPTSGGGSVIVTDPDPPLPKVADPGAASPAVAPLGAGKGGPPAAARDTRASRPDHAATLRPDGAGYAALAERRAEPGAAGIGDDRPLPGPAQAPGAHAADGEPHTLLAPLQGGGALHAAPRSPPAPAPAVLVPLAAVAVEIAGRAQSGSRHFDIRLDPPELGRIEVRLHLDAQGHVTSHLVADRADTLDLLRRDAGELERALQQAGLKTSDNSLNFSLRQQGQDVPDGPARGAPARLLAEAEPLPQPALRSYRPLGLGLGLDIRV